MAFHSVHWPLGQYGATRVTVGTTTGTWCAIQCLGRVTLTTLTDAANPANAWAGTSLADGTVLTGYFTSITISTGVAIAFPVR